MTKETKQLSANIKTLRKANKWSQAEFGKRIGLDQSAVSRSENGHQEWGIATLIKVSKLLKFSEAEMLHATIKKEQVK